MAYCPEADIINFSEARDYPVIPCNLCGSQENMQRQVIKQMLSDWQKQYPGRVENIFASIKNVAPSHLADRNLYDFLDFSTHQSQSEEKRQTPVDYEPVNILNI